MTFGSKRNSIIISPLSLSFFPCDSLACAMLQYFPYHHHYSAQFYIPTTS